MPATPVQCRSRRWNNTADSVGSGFCTGNPGQADGVLAGHIAAVVDVTGGGTRRGEPMPELAPLRSALTGEVVGRVHGCFPTLDRSRASCIRGCARGSIV
jgi:hypothetical protein